MNHVTISGIDTLLSNGSTEIALNGIEVTQDSNLLHGDVLSLPSYKLVYLDPNIDVTKLKVKHEIKHKAMIAPTAENSNTESAEEATSKTPPVKPKIKTNSDAAWRKRISEATFDLDDLDKDTDRPIVPLSANERPDPQNAVSFVSGKESEILRYATSVDCEDNEEYLICSVLICQIVLHTHLNCGTMEVKQLLDKVLLTFRKHESELKAEIVEYKLQNPIFFNDDTENQTTSAQNAVGMMMCRIPLMLKIFGLSANAAEVSIFGARALEMPNCGQVTELRELSQRVVMSALEVRMGVTYRNVLYDFTALTLLSLAYNRCHYSSCR